MEKNCMFVEKRPDLSYVDKSNGKEIKLGYYPFPEYYDYYKDEYIDEDKETDELRDPKIVNGIEYFDLSYYKLNELFLVHSTPHENVEYIINSGFILDQISRNKINLKHSKGLGKFSKRTEILDNPNQPYSEICDKKTKDIYEVRGVYFFIYTKEEIERLYKESLVYKTNNIYIVFPAEILLKYKSWHYNTVDNCGFYLNNGKTACLGKTYDMEIFCHTLNVFYKKFVDDDNGFGEVVIQDNVSIEDVLCVI